MSRLRVGTDLVQVSRIAKALDAFGERFVRRVFTDGEAAYAYESPSGIGAPGALAAGRLATRFAAKECAKKVFALEGVGWRDIEVQRRPSGAPDLVLHGAARAVADAAGAGELALSMSRDGDYATAVLVVLCDLSKPTEDRMSPK